MKNKGFTLIELLGVIVVLAIVALISMPLVLDAVSKSAKGAYEESLRNVIAATDIYIASDEFSGMPDEGIEITSDVIKMKNKRFTSGIVFRNADDELELSNASDGTYCGGGTLKRLIIIKSSCDTLDSTNPTLSIATNLVTSSAITVAATGNDPESGIASYQYSKDNGETWTSKQASSTYEFTGLTEGTTYDIKVKVYNNNVSYVLTATKGLSATTVAIPAPTYAVNTTDWTQSKTVTITYPERKEGYVYEYSLDEASTWTEVSGTDTTKVLTFNANGNVIARVSDGTNIVSGTTYEVTNINTTPPVIVANPAVLNAYQGFTYTDEGITATDDIEGDISDRIVTTGTVNVNSLGTYTLRYNVTDNAGNVALEVARVVTVISPITNFAYTGSVQTFTVPVNGTYKLEVWGAKGGCSLGGYGGYSYSTETLTAGTVLKIVAGGQGVCNSNSATFGGGGGIYTTTYGGSGGGASAIGVNNSLFYVIAGGGGGGTTSTSCYPCAGGNSYGGHGAGGNNRGGSGTSYYTSVATGGLNGSGGSGAYAGGASNANGSGSYGGSTPGYGIGGGGTGASGDYATGGGGGGYGGGGGSYNSSSNGGGTGAGGGGYAKNGGGTTGANSTGHGYAKITLISQ